MAMAQSKLPKFHQPKTRQNPSSHWEAHSAYLSPVAFLPELNGVHLPYRLPNKLKQSGGKLPTCWGLLVTSWENDGQRFAQVLSNRGLGMVDIQVLEGFEVDALIESLTGWSSQPPRK